MRRNMAREMRSTMESSRATAVAGRCVCDNSAASPSNAPGSATSSASAARSGLSANEPSLDDVGAVGGLAGREQHLAGFDRIGLGADGEDAQRRSAEAAQNRHLAQKRNVILDGHDRSAVRAQNHDCQLMVPSHGTSL